MVIVYPAGNVKLLPFLQTVLSCALKMKTFPLAFLLFLLVHSGAWCQVVRDTVLISGIGIQPGEKMTVGKIIIKGNKITRRAVILREMSIHEGDVILSDSLLQLQEQNQLRLYNLSIFNSVSLQLLQSAGVVDWYIDVTERWYIIPTLTVQFADRNFNTWWDKQDHDLNRIMVGLTVTDKNFRGNLESLSATVQLGYTQKLGINYQLPYLDKKRTKGLGFLFSMSQSQQTYYNTDSNKLQYVGTYTGKVIQRQTEAGISYIYRPAYASRHIVQVTYKDYTVSDTVLKLNPEYFDNVSRNARFVELAYRYEYNGVDNWNYSLVGHKLVSNLVLRSGFEGIKFQGYLNLEAGLFRNIFPKWYFSTIFRGRLMYPQEQPYYFRGGLGTQTDYVRGYEYYIIDGSSYGLLRLDLKREIFNRTYSLPLQYFTAIPLRVYPKIFVDAGYIDSPSPGNSFLSNKLTYSIGAGLDVVTLYDIKIRFEFAYNHLKQNGLYLHFNSE
jgi:outer membrane protein assembly factor BamA